LGTGKRLFGEGTIPASFRLIDTQVAMKGARNVDIRKKAASRTRCRFFVLKRDFRVHPRGLLRQTGFLF
jgi:hypothetical protein